METLAQTWLTCQCQMISAIARGVVVVVDEQAGVSHRVAQWPAAAQELRDLEIAARTAVKQDRVLSTAKASEEGDGPERCIFALPVGLPGSGPAGVAFEVAAIPGWDPLHVLGLLRAGVAWARQMSGGDEVRNRLIAVLDVVAASLEHETYEASATAVVTELATRLGFERVGLGFSVKGRCAVEAISGSASFDARTNPVRALGFAMDEAADQDAVCLYPPRKDAPPVILRAHETLAGEAGVTSICTIPLGVGGRAVGALCFESGDPDGPDAQTLALCEDMALLLGPLLHLKRGADRSLRERFADSFRQQRKRLFGPGHIELKLGVLGSVVALAVVLLMPAEHRITAGATLEGRVRRAIVAGVEGYVGEARARAGDIVKAGQVLALLDDRDLLLERQKRLGEQRQVQNEHREALAGHDRAQVSMLHARLAQGVAELELLEEKLSRTQLLAPFDGVVVRGDLTQSLGSPVEKGEVLFEVTPLSGYRIMLQLDERDVRQVRRGRRGKLMLSALPGRSLPLTIERLTPVAVAEDGRNFFRAEASLDEPVEGLHPGMEGYAKISAGHRPLIWIWLHGLWDSLRMWLWHWLP